MDDGTGDAPKPKRTRLAAKKIRCDELLPSCTPCLKAKVTCVVTKPSANSLVAPVRRKTGPGRSSSVTGQSQQGSHAKRSDGGSARNGTGGHSYGAGDDASHASSSASPQSPDRYTDRHAQASSSTSRGPATLAHLLQAAEQPNMGSLTPESHAKTSARPGSQTQPSHQRNGGGGQARFTESGIVHNVDDRRKFVGASSSQALLKWLDMESSGARLASHLTHGMQSTEQYTFPGQDTEDEDLPDNEQLNEYLDTWFSNHYAWPFLDEASTRQLVKQPRSKLDPVNRALLHALIANAADYEGPTGFVSEAGEHHLRLAWLSLPSLMGRPFRSSVQTILLLVLALRNRSKDGLSWTLCATAVRIGFSYGMHLKGAGPLASLDARIWYCAYSLDKVTSFEAGRPSSIDDRTCVIRPSAIGSSATFVLPGYAHPVDVLSVYSTLCQQAEAISTQLFTQLSSSLSPEEALRRIGERDAALTRWAESVPLELRPGNDPPTPNALLPYTTMIHHLYHHLLITLHRLSLFDHAKIVLPELCKPSLQPYAGRLQNSISICLNSARSTLSSLERVSAHFPNCRTWTLHPVFTAIIVLAIHTWQFPATWQARADLAILEHATAFAAEVFTRVGFPQEFVEVLPRLYRKTKDKVDRPLMPSRPPSRGSSPGLQQTETGGVTSLATSRRASVFPGAGMGPQVGLNVEAANAQLASAANEGLQTQGYPGLGEEFGTTVGWDGSIVQSEFESLWPFLLGNGGWPTLDGSAIGSNNDANAAESSNLTHDMFLLPASTHTDGQAEQQPNASPGPSGVVTGGTTAALLSLAEGVTAHGPIQGDLMFDPGFLSGSGFA
ncbi:hypothetical protein OIV83_001141 [Microbotryomycetes sp. JL201]|nr:hypothetical protein OIV83_001141 [Microbotryomycetes sp. JL201]